MYSKLKRAYTIALEMRKEVTLVAKWTAKSEKNPARSNRCNCYLKMRHFGRMKRHLDRNENHCKHSESRWNPKRIRFGSEKKRRLRTRQKRTPSVKKGATPINKEPRRSHKKSLQPQE